MKLIANDFVTISKLQKNYKFFKEKNCFRVTQLQVKDFDTICTVQAKLNVFLNNIYRNKKEFFFVRKRSVSRKQIFI